MINPNVSITCVFSITMVKFEMGREVNGKLTLLFHRHGDHIIKHSNQYTFESKKDAINNCTVTQV